MNSRGPPPKRRKMEDDVRGANAQDDWGDIDDEEEFQMSQALDVYESTQGLTKKSSENHALKESTINILGKPIETQVPNNPVVCFIEGYFSSVTFIFVIYTRFQN